MTSMRRPELAIPVSATDSKTACVVPPSHNQVEVLQPDSKIYSMLLQLIADSKFLQLESLVELVKAIVHAAGPLQRLNATPESMESTEVPSPTPFVSRHKVLLPSALR